MVWAGQAPALAYFSTLPANKAVYFLLDYQWYWWVTMAG